MPSFLSRTYRWILNLNFRIEKTSDLNANVFHHVAVFLQFFLVFLLIFALINKKNIRPTELLELISVVLALVGTIWIASGVYYIRPKSITMADSTLFNNHVVETLAFASRCSVIGILIIGGSFLLHLWSTSLYIRTL